MPVTCRLDEEDVAKLDEAVIAGLAPNRAALVSQAVAEWLDSHDEELIAESYRRAYAEPDPEHDKVMDGFLQLSVEAIFGAEGDDAPG